MTIEDTAKHFNGAPCRRCGSRVRYVNGGKCVPCSRSKWHERQGTKPMNLVPAADGAMIAPDPMYKLIMEGKAR